MLLLDTLKYVVLKFRDRTYVIIINVIDYKVYTENDEKMEKSKLLRYH